MQDFLSLIYILFLLQIFVPMLQKRLMQGLRINAIPPAAPGARERRD